MTKATIAQYGWRLVKSALKQRLFGIRQVKLKVDDAADVKAVRLLRQVFGRNFDVRWTPVPRSCIPPIYLLYSLRGVWLPRSPLRLRVYYPQV